MALHLRDQIIDAITAALTGLTTTGANVFTDRDIANEPLADTALPALNIEQGDESSIPVSLGYPRTVQATVTVDIAAHTKRATGTLARKQANLIAQEVQVALYANRQLGGLNEKMTLSRTSYTPSSESDSARGELTMSVEVEYFYKEDRPDV